MHFNMIFFLDISLFVVNRITSEFQHLVTDMHQIYFYVKNLNFTIEIALPSLIFATNQKCVVYFIFLA